MGQIQSVFITGANAGLGLECARQLGLREEVRRIYIGCRNKEKALEARSVLESATGRLIFEIVLLDVMDLKSVRDAVSAFDRPIDAVVLNAGGMGGRQPTGMTSDGVTNMFAVNVLGHSVLVDELLSRQLVTSTVLLSGSEAARGISRMGVAPPQIDNWSTEEFVSIADGSKFEKDSDPMSIYGSVKLLGALWIASMARQHPHVKFVTMSPGGTAGTNGFDDMPFGQRVLFKYVGGLIMPLLGMMHSVRVGARRYVDGLTDPKFVSGGFYASAGGAPTGRVVDQRKFIPELEDPQLQDNAYEAVHQFIR